MKSWQLVVAMICMNNTVVPPVGLEQTLANVFWIFCSAIMVCLSNSHKEKV
jgi:hypothetical protein